MGKKVKEYKSGDFIFAKVKGYPAWPARVQRLNGKKYFVYFYGTGETANLAPNMIFDYAENKDKFLTKTVKRRDFNDGVKQIEYDFANNVPLEQVIGVPMEDVAEGANDTADSAIDATMDDSVADTTANDTVANDTVADDANATQNDAIVEDSDDAGALVIDEGKASAKGKKTKVDSAKTPAKEAPKAKEAKTPRGKGKKEELKNREEEKTIDEELVSRSGRKIRPKRYIDEQTEDNATLPSPMPKRRRGASPPPEKEKADSAKEKEAKTDKTFTQFNAVKQSELEGLKEPFKPADEDKDNILIAYLPNGTYVGIKLFQSRPTSFKNESSRLQWDKQAAANAITLKMQLERDQITPQSIQAQLVMDLNLTDEEKATLDKERETEEKKSRVNFLKTEMKLIELDAKIKTCLCLEKADTELCLKLLDELLALDVKPLMLLKHPTCLETVKRMRAYVGNTPSWDLSESAALVFSKQAHRIRKKADMLYKGMKEHFQTPDGLSFWEYFSERVLVFKKVTSNLNAGELLEMVHEPIELSQPNAHTMRSAIEQANNTVPPLPDSPEVEEEEKHAKKKGPAGKAKKSSANSTPSKAKRASRNKKDDEQTQEPLEPQKQTENTAEVTENEPEGNKDSEEINDKDKIQEDDGEKIAEEPSKDTPNEPEVAPQEANEDVEMAEPEKPSEIEQNTTEAETATEDPKESETNDKKDTEKATRESKDKNKDNEKPTREERSSKRDKRSRDDKMEQSRDDDSDKSAKDSDKGAKGDKSPSKSSKEEKHSRDGERSAKDRKSSRDERISKESSKNGKEKDDSESKDDKEEKEKQDNGESRAKRSRDSKKTEPPPPRSPAKRKSKF